MCINSYYSCMSRFLNCFNIQFNVQETHEQYVYDTWDLVNGLGGLVGLFLGSSILSFTEGLILLILRLVHETA